MKNMPEDRFMDVLQNIEFTVIEFYRAHPELNDYQVDKIFNGLLRVYKVGPDAPPPQLKLTELEQQLFDAIQAICDWRLGRRPPEEQSSLPEGLPLSVEDILAVLKRLRRSIELWTKEYGRQGYLNYVASFFSKGRS